jgi:hypothetical protein
MCHPNAPESLRALPDRYKALQSDPHHLGRAAGSRTDATGRQRAAVDKLHRDLVGMVDEMTVG